MAAISMMSFRPMRSEMGPKTRAANMAGSWPSRDATNLSTAVSALVPRLLMVQWFLVSLLIRSGVQNLVTACVLGLLETKQTSSKLTERI